MNDDDPGLAKVEVVMVSNETSLTLKLLHINTIMHSEKSAIMMMIMQNDKRT